MNLFNLIELILPLVVLVGIFTIMHTLEKIHQDLQTLIHLQWDATRQQISRQSAGEGS